MDSLTHEAINYASKVSKENVTVQSISTFRNNKDACNFENDSIMCTLKELQAKGLISKFNKPIDIATASKLLFLVLHVNDISNNESINRSIPALINRSLFSARAAHVNTTPRFLPINNATTNARLEQLEYRLSVKIMAMK